MNEKNSDFVNGPIRADLPPLPAKRDYVMGPAGLDRCDYKSLMKTVDLLEVQDGDILTLISGEKCLVLYGLGGYFFQVKYLDGKKKGQEKILNTEMQVVTITKDDRIMDDQPVYFEKSEPPKPQEH